MEEANNLSAAVEVIGITLTAIGALVGFAIDYNEKIKAERRASLAPVLLTAAGTLVLFSAIVIHVLHLG